MKEFLKTHSLEDCTDLIDWYLQHPVWGKEPGAFCNLFQEHLVSEWEDYKSKLADDYE